MLNPLPRLSGLHATPGHTVPDAVIIDDALLQPQALVDLAEQHRAAFAAPTGNAFPGPELPLPPTVVDFFVDQFAEHAAVCLGAGPVVSATGRLSMVTLSPSQLMPLQRLCHRDRLTSNPAHKVVAGVLYLFQDERLGGTVLFRPREPVQRLQARMDRWAAMDREAFERDTGWPAAYFTTSNEVFEQVAVIPPRWNRLTYYDGGQFHGGHIEHPELLCDDPRRGRLTINLFFVCE
jgi:Family of unknown function (DUF6445)